MNFKFQSLKSESLNGDSRKTRQGDSSDSETNTEGRKKTKAETIAKPGSQQEKKS